MLGNSLKSGRIGIKNRRTNGDSHEALRAFYLMVQHLCCGIQRIVGVTGLLHPGSLAFWASFIRRDIADMNLEIGCSRLSYGGTFMRRTYDTLQQIVVGIAQIIEQGQPGRVFGIPERIQEVRVPYHKHIQRRHDIRHPGIHWSFCHDGQPQLEPWHSVQYS